MWMRIVDTDNFGGDYPDERFLCLGDAPLRFRPTEAQRVADVLNEGHEHSGRYYKVVSDDYVLQPGFEP